MEFGQTKLVEIRPEFDGLLDPSSYTKAQLVDDYLSLLQIARLMVDQNALDFYHTKDADISDLTPLKNAIVILFDLNILSDEKLDDLMIAGLSIAEMDEDFYYSLGINWNEEEASLLRLIDLIMVFFDTPGVDITYISDAKDFVNNVIDDYTILMTDEIFTVISDIGLEIAGSPLLIGLALVGASTLVYLICKNTLKLFLNLMTLQSKKS